MPLCERCKREVKEELLNKVQYPGGTFTNACPPCYDGLNYSRIQHNKKYKTTW